MWSVWTESCYGCHLRFPVRAVTTNQIRKSCGSRRRKSVFEKLYGSFCPIGPVENHFGVFTQPQYV